MKFKFIWQYWKFNFNSEKCSYNIKHISVTSQTNKCCYTLWREGKYTFPCSCKIMSNREEKNSVSHLMKGKLTKCLVNTFTIYLPNNKCADLCLGFSNSNSSSHVYLYDFNYRIMAKKYPTFLLYYLVYRNCTLDKNTRILFILKSDILDDIRYWVVKDI